MRRCHGFKEICTYKSTKAFSQTTVFNFRADQTAFHIKRYQKVGTELYAMIQFASWSLKSTFLSQWCSVQNSLNVNLPCEMICGLIFFVYSITLFLQFLSHTMI